MAEILMFNMIIKLIRKLIFNKLKINLVIN